MLRLSEIELHEAITQYWLDYYVSDDITLCTLCGNSGEIDTKGRAISGAGIDAGRVNFCICPNGQTMRQQTNEHQTK